MAGAGEERSASRQKKLCIWALLSSEVYTQIHNLWILGSARRADSLGFRLPARFGRSAAEEDLQCNADLRS